ncbi:MAG: ABC transporter permease [Candidatus Zixiibacteriota bacterium]|nr:MAG: ABC transporter permease [candidate division Zixibacteria bacterium]
MILLENVKLAMQSLRLNPLRTVLTLIGIAVGIAAVLYVVVLGEITQRRINDRLESLGSNVLMIRPGFGHRHGVRTASGVVNLKWDDAREIENSSGVINVCVPTYSASAMTEYQDKNWSTRVTGTTPDYETVNNSSPIEGRYFTEAELMERSQVCIIGATVHTELFGDVSPVGQSILIRSKRFEVIGLLGAVGESWFNPDDQIFMPLTTAQERLYGVDNLSSILAQLKSSDDYEEALFDIEHILRRNHRLRPDQDNDFRVRRQDFFLATIQDTNKELADFIILIALISLVVGGIGIANVMLVSVAERVREIGIRRAVGANKAMIIAQFLTEAVALGLVGGLIGIVGGMAFNRLIIGQELILPWFWMFNSGLICMTIGVVAGVYPAFRAANIDVIDALHHE